MKQVSRVSSNFFSMLFRMKYIDRWALMRNSRNETLTEHTLEVAVLAHALATLGNVRLGKAYSADRAAVLGLFHDAHEILTGDMPTPVKYQNFTIETAFKDVEKAANDTLVSMLPEDLQKIYEPLLQEEDAELKPLVKAADKLSALIKCMEERKTGNQEFRIAEQSTREALEKMQLQEVNIFLEEFLPAIELTLDEMR
ncbi:MAG: 5'-deoxynucleotidase [Clostridia bacterium]|nr:5'-deoxynucleotidase [Clostridia bacterium]